MILQMLGAGACLWGIDYIAWRPKRELRKKWNLIMAENNLINENNETFNIAKINETEYGYLLIVGVPVGFSYDNLEKIKAKIEDSLKCMAEMEHNKLNGWIKIRLIMRPFEDKEYKPIPTEPYELYLGYNYIEYIKIDMNKSPHLLITGATGTGKNCAAEIVLSTLIANHTKEQINIYLTQLMKKELIYFKRYEQINKMAFNLNDAIELFKELETIINERMELIGRHIEAGIKNIKQYNEKFSRKLPYIYLVIDEYLFYMPEKADTKEEKEQKAYCLSVIKKVLFDGRALGIFAIILTQRPDSESITGSFKAQVTNILCFRQVNEVSSRVAIETEDATKLNDREAILKTNTYQIIKTPFVSDEIIRAALKHREKPKIEPKKIENKVQYVQCRELTKEEYEEIMRRKREKLQKNIVSDGVIKKVKKNVR